MPDFELFIGGKYGILHVPGGRGVKATEPQIGAVKQRFAAFLGVLQALWAREGVLPCKVVREVV